MKLPGTGLQLNEYNVNRGEVVLSMLLLPYTFNYVSIYHHRHPLWFLCNSTEGGAGRDRDGVHATKKS